MATGNQLLTIGLWAATIVVWSAEPKPIKPVKVYGDTFLRHQHVMSYYGLRLLPSKNQLTSLGADGVRVWDLKSRKQLFYAPTEAYGGLILSPSGDRVAVKTNESLSIWSLKEKKLLFKTVFEEDKTLQGMGISCFLSEGTLEAVGKSQAYEWNWSKKSLRKTWSLTEPFTIEKVCRIDNDRLVAVVGPPKGSRSAPFLNDEDRKEPPFETGVWDLRQKKLLWTSKVGHFLRASPDGKTLVYCKGDDWFLVDTLSGNVISQKVPVVDGAFPVWSGNDAVLIFSRKRFHLRNAKTWKSIADIPNPYGYRVKSIAWDHKVGKIYVGSGHTIFVHDLKGMLLHPDEDVFISGAHSRFAYRPKTDSIIVGEDGCLVTLDLKNGKRAKVKIKEEEPLAHWRFSPMQPIATYQSKKAGDPGMLGEDRITVVDLSGKELGQIGSLLTTDYYQHVLFHPTKRKILRLDDSLAHRLLTYTVADGLQKEVLKLQPPPRQPTDTDLEQSGDGSGLVTHMNFDRFCLSPDGLHMVAWSNYDAHVFYLRTGRFCQKFEPDDIHNCQAEYLQNGRLLTIVYPPRLDRPKRIFLTRLRGRPLPKEGLKPLIAKLGAGIGRERKEAEKEILEYGQHALAPLGAVKTDDPEVTARIKGIVKAIQAGPPYDFIQCKFEIKANEYLSEIVPLRHKPDECLLLVSRPSPDQDVILHVKALEDDLKILNVYGDNRNYGWVQGTPDGRIIALGGDGTVSVFRMVDAKPQQ